jgi:hypothetical protein
VNVNLMYDVLVRRGALRELRVDAHPAPSESGLAPGSALLRIERFALTANNVTYAAFGDAPGLGYWRFFPAPEGWGRVPVWGFASVVASTHPEVSVGERVYGYFPMSTHVVLLPERADSLGFCDGAAHRQGLSPVYNRYLRVPPRPGQDPVARDALEAGQMLLRPLFTTSFLIDDFLDEAAFFGARRVLMSSASSKTAYGTAFLLHRRGAAGGAPVELVGLTSSANRDFVSRLGCYARVLTYEQISGLDRSVPTVYVDLSGDAALRGRVHVHLGDALMYDCAVGGTHWEGVAGPRPQGAPSLPGPKPVMFFAPARWRQRAADWGEAGFAQRLGEARDAFGARLADDGWMTVVEGRGAAEVMRIWRELVDGRGRPEQGNVLALMGD